MGSEDAELQACRSPGTAGRSLPWSCTSSTQPEGAPRPMAGRLDRGVADRFQPEDAPAMKAIADKTAAAIFPK
jgi:hypothetical protein